MSKREILNYGSILPDNQAKKVERQNPFVGLEMPEGYRQKAKRLGRGRGSGLGKTSGRGQKGQRARTGYSKTWGFEGGQMPLHRRLPKRGFTNIFKKDFQVVNLWRLGKAGAAGEIGPEQMKKLGLIDDAKRPVKVLGDGEIKSALKITADSFSDSAKNRIEAAGGSCTIRERKSAAN